MGTQIDIPVGLMFASVLITMEAHGSSLNLVCVHSTLNRHRNAVFFNNNPHVLILRMEYFAHSTASSYNAMPIALTRKQNNTA